MKKDYIPMPLEWLEMFSDFNDEEFGLLARAWLAYCITGEALAMPDRALTIALKTMTTKADYYTAKFESVSEKRKAAGEKGGKKKPADEEEAIANKTSNCKQNKQMQSNFAIADISNQSNQINSNHINSYQEERKKERSEKSELSTGFSTDFSTGFEKTGIDWLDDCVTGLMEKRGAE